jgi:hypothetical protein
MNNLDDSSKPLKPLPLSKRELTKLYILLERYAYGVRKRRGFEDAQKVHAVIDIATKELAEYERLVSN